MCLTMAQGAIAQDRRGPSRADEFFDLGEYWFDWAEDPQEEFIRALSRSNALQSVWMEEARYSRNSDQLADFYDAIQAHVAEGWDESRAIEDGMDHLLELLTDEAANALVYAIAVEDYFKSRTLGIPVERVEEAELPYDAYVTQISLRADTVVDHLLEIRSLDPRDIEDVVNHANEEGGGSGGFSMPSDNSSDGMSLLECIQQANSTVSPMPLPFNEVGTTPDPEVLSWFDPMSGMGGYSGSTPMDVCMALDPSFGHVHNSTPAGTNPNDTPEPSQPAQPTTQPPATQPDPNFHFTTTKTKQNGSSSTLTTESSLTPSGGGRATGSITVTKIIRNAAGEIVDQDSFTDYVVDATQADINDLWLDARDRGIVHSCCDPDDSIHHDWDPPGPNPGGSGPTPPHPSGDPRPEFDPWADYLDRCYSAYYELATCVANAGGDTCIPDTDGLPGTTPYPVLPDPDSAWYNTGCGDSTAPQERLPGYRPEFYTDPSPILVASFLYVALPDWDVDKIVADLETDTWLMSDVMEMLLVMSMTSEAPRR